MWKTTLEVEIACESMPDPQALSAIKDAIMHGAMETAIGGECGEVEITLVTIRRPHKTLDCGHDLDAQSVLGHCRACDFEMGEMNA